MISNLFPIRLSITTLCLALAVIATGCNQPANRNTSTANSSPTQSANPTRDRAAKTDTNSATAPVVTATDEAETPDQNRPSTKQQTAAFRDGRYLVGQTGQGLEIDGDRYRYNDEEGPQPWRSVTELQAVKEGVIHDGNSYWCLNTMKPRDTIGSCSENGWVTQTASTSVDSDNRKLLFSCATNDAKQILLYDSGATIDYRFGKVEYPLEQAPQFVSELDLSVPRAEVENYQWSGFGRNMSYSVTVPNGNVSYRVFSSLDKLDKTHTPEGGVEVRENGNLIATVNCKGNIKSNLKGFSL
jgi:hypothetical protein